MLTYLLAAAIFTVALVLLSTIGLVVLDALTVIDQFLTKGD